MDRRVFLKLTGLLAAASAFEALPVSAAGPVAAAPIAEPLRSPISVANPSVARLRVGEAVHLSDHRYRPTGRPDGGDQRRQQLAAGVLVGRWHGPRCELHVVRAVRRAWVTPEIRVSGGQIESLSIVRLDYV